MQKEKVAGIMTEQYARSSDAVRELEQRRNNELLLADIVELVKNKHKTVSDRTLAVELVQKYHGKSFSELLVRAIRQAEESKDV